MKASEAQNWLIPVSSAVGILSTAVAAWIAVLNYRVKAKAETRLAQSATVERDIQLVRLFAELMNVAHARGASQLSEQAVAYILKNCPVEEISKMLPSAVVTMPVGLAAQDAAIVAIGTLGEQHQILREASIQALKTLSSFKGEIASKVLNELIANRSIQAKDV